MEEKKSKKEKKSKRSGHKKIKSSDQLLTTTHNFKLALTELPESFFEEMILTEIDLSEEFSMDKLQNLIRLYSEAIEYYMQYDPSQVRYFQGRMEILLTNTDTLKKLKKQSEAMDKKEENNNIVGENSGKNIIKVDEIKENKNKNKGKSQLIKEIELRTDNLDFNNISNEVNKVIGDYDINNPQNKKGIDIITEDLNKQSEKWKEKLKKKKNLLRNSDNVKLRHQRGISLDIMKAKSENLIRDNKTSDKNDKDKEMVGMNKFEKMKNMFSEGIFEEVKEENEGEGSDKENEIKVKDDKLKDLKDNKNKNPDKKKDLEEIEKNIDEKILKSVNERMDLLMKLIGDIENNKLAKDEDEETIQENNNPIKEKDEFTSLSNIIKVPLKFQSTYFQVENLIIQYMDQFNNFFFKEIFEQFASNLKEIYDNKYKKYIDVSLEYHHQIKENEHLLENHKDFSEEKKAEIQQIIDSLKEEQQNQIATIEDEFNRLIVSKVNEFKLDSFKNNSGILLIEERLKLEIYSIINESFYSN